VKYMLLILNDTKAWEEAPPEASENLTREYMAFTNAIIESKEIVGGDPLEGPETATTVRVHDGDRILTDGPFAETREVLGGYYIVDVTDLDRALQLASELPGAKRGLDTVEVRPVRQLPEGTPGT
jgi:hypothetical protein